MSTDAEVLSEIARLKSAIQQARQPSLPRGRGSHRGYAPSQRGRGRGGNRSLVLNKPLLASAATTVQIDPLATPAPKAKSVVQSAASENVPPVASTSREVVIDGVTFMSDARGKKLVRRGAVEAAVATPPRASVGGQTYVRTKNGNLVALALVNKRTSDDKVKRMTAMLSSNRQFPGSRGSPRKRAGRPLKQINELCRFFTTTGQCRSGLTCVYQHDPDKLAVCPRFVRGKCNLGDACPLSHTADGHRMPHCVHFPNCRHGSSCRFPHVHVSATAGICRPFATLGYCAKGLACPERHVRECPEFSDKGTCAIPNCRLPHIIRKKAGEGGTAAQIEYASDSDDNEEEEEAVAQHKRKLPSSEDAPVVITRKRRLHDNVAAQADFLTFDDSFDQSMAPSDDDDDVGAAEAGADAVQSDVDSDAMGSDQDSL